MSGMYRVTKRRADQWNTKWWVVGPDGDVQGFKRDDERHASDFCQALNAAYAAGQAGVEEIRKALEPFANLATQVAIADEIRARHLRDEGHRPGPDSPDHRHISVSLGECRAAARVLAPQTNTRGKEKEESV